jgi:hypothetical protein
MSSNWNRYLEARLAGDLNSAESRLLDAIARETLGWSKLERQVGEGTLRERSRLDGRSFSRARKSLIEKGLLDYTPGKPGRPDRGGARGSYHLALKPAVERGLKTEGNAVLKPAVERGLTEKTRNPHKSREKTAILKPAVERGGKEIGKDTGRRSPNTPKRRGNQELVGQVIVAYSDQGGNLEKNGWRAMLAKHAADLLKAGNEADLIVVAAGVLARESDPFPGNLTKLVKQIREHGMPCKHRGDLRGLSKALLVECGCPNCLGRIAYAEEHGLDTAYLEPLKAA